MQDQSDILTYIRRESLDVYNRLHSIAEDVEFVNLVHEAYPNLPLLRKSNRFVLHLSQIRRLIDQSKGSEFAMRGLVYRSKNCMAISITSIPA